MKEVYGDVIKMAKEGQFDLIVHGANCFNVMGAGVARQIAKEFPGAYEADRLTTAEDRTKLGSISTYFDEGHKVYIVNAYTQYEMGGERAVSYDAIDDCFKEIANRYFGLKVGYPAIGAGLGGGQWNIIREIIDYRLKDMDHALVIYQPQSENV